MTADGLCLVFVVQEALQLRVSATEGRIADVAREEVRRRCSLGSDPFDWLLVVCVSIAPRDQVLCSVAVCVQASSAVRLFTLEVFSYGAVRVCICAPRIFPCMSAVSTAAGSCPPFPLCRRPWLAHLALASLRLPPWALSLCPVITC